MLLAVYNPAIKLTKQIRYHYRQVRVSALARKHVGQWIYMYDTSLSFKKDFEMKAKMVIGQIKK